MSSLTMTNGVGNVQTIDVVSPYIDMEPYGLKWYPAQDGTYTSGLNGVVELNITSITWSSSYASLDPVYDKVFFWLDLAGYNSLTMTPPNDANGVQIGTTKDKGYRISTPTGSIVFSAATNPAKYVWTVLNGLVQGASLESDMTFVPVSLYAIVESDNRIPVTQPIVFTMYYTLSFVDLGSTITGSATGNNNTLTVNASTPSAQAFITNTVFTNVQSGYIVTSFSQLSSTSVFPTWTAGYDPQDDLTQNSAEYYIQTAGDNATIYSAYTARQARTKVFSTTPKFALFAVNQGKVSSNATTVNNNYQLIHLLLNENGSEDLASATVTYGVTAVTI